MHEMSLVEGIVDIVCDVAQREGATRVRNVYLEVGALSGAEPDALQFCWEAVTRGTVVEGAELVIQEKKVEAHCIDCGQDFAVTDWVFRCPACDSALLDIQQGRELRVTSVDLDTE